MVITYARSYQLGVEKGTLRPRLPRGTADAAFDFLMKTAYNGKY